MKRIRKIETSVGLTGNVVNNQSTSTANAYSCDYINNDLKALILDMAHPIGSYYWSSDATNPHDLFGGTWVQIKDKFIIAVGDNHTVGQSYGSNTKDISHTHGIGHTHGVPGVAHTHSYAHTHGVPGVAHKHSIPSHYHWTPYMDYNGHFAILNTSGTTMHKRGTGLVPSQDTDNWMFVKSGTTGATSGGYQHSVSDSGALNSDNTTPSATTTNSQSTSTSGSTTPSATTTNSQSTSTSGSGGSTTLDITPACEAAYCWKRTA